MKTVVAAVAAVVMAGTAFAADVVVENARFRLTVGADAKVKSLVIKATGEECVSAPGEIPLFASEQERPFDDELKIIHPNKRRAFAADSLRREGDRLVAGFEIVPYEATVEVKETDAYVEFRLAGFTTDYYDHCHLGLDKPPVSRFRLLQLPVADRDCFGDLLNASWDAKGAVAVVGTTPEADVDHENRRGYKVLTAGLVREIRLRGGSAAIVVGNGREDFLDCMDRLERDFGLPRGVASRRSPHVNASLYHDLDDTTPLTVDKHIAWAKKGGFRYMTVSTGGIVKGDGEWGCHGDYDWREEYPNREEDLRKMVARIKAAGIHPGLHFLHTHIGLKSRYVTPVADPRLSLTRHFTLAKPLGAGTNDTELVVQESTAGTVMAKGRRILRFGGELISYESYTSERPCRFLGVRRGAHGTRVVAHPRGEIGGILDVSEYGTPTSCYLDQDSDLQEEVAAKIAKLYNCGFEYVYFDGAEGVQAPFGYHVANAMYRQWRMFDEPPLFAEGAAKSHFAWHMLSGSNAFDCFVPGEFKRRLMEFPAAQAPLAWQDMTRCNFGWWFLFPPKDKGSPEVAIGTQPDMWEFGSAVSYAWDCPATMLVGVKYIDLNPRADDIFEVLRRWEDIREHQLLGREQKERLKLGKGDHHLYLNEDGGYELLDCEVIGSPAKAPEVRAFVFERKGRRVLAYWNMRGSGTMSIDLGRGRQDVPTGRLRYLESDLPAEGVKRAYAAAKSPVSTRYRTPGIIGGMGPAATCDLMQKVIDNTDAPDDQHNIHILVDQNTDVPDRTAAILKGGADPMPELVRSAKRLEAAGADFLCMSCNTAHYFHERLQKEVAIPILNMPAESAKELKRRGVRKVGLLATDGTIRTGVYHRFLKQEGVEVVAPEGDDQRAVMSLIYDCVKKNVPTEEYPKEAIARTVANLKAKGAEAYLLACTELPIAFERLGYGDGFVDPTLVLARAIVREAGAPIRDSKH